MYTKSRDRVFGLRVKLSVVFGTRLSVGFESKAGCGFWDKIESCV